jgi:hypothetical protein
MYLKHLRQLLAHKWHVFLAGLRTGAPLWRLIIHDWSKFTPAEFAPYARWYCDDRARWSGIDKWAYERRYNRAWLHHVHHSPHHWNFHILPGYGGSQTVLDMSEPFVREMVADWMGASRTYTGSYEMGEWLKQTLPSITVSPLTALILGRVLDELGYETRLNLLDGKFEAAAA